MISVHQIDGILRSYGFAAPVGLAEKIRVYIELLVTWNRTISLTTVTDPLEIAKFHFGESLFAVSQVEMQKSRLADLGTGAGFPGLPLAMAIPSLQVTLIESNQKKCAFLAEVLRKLEIGNATVYHGRMESFPPDADNFDFITARALGHFAELLKWAKSRLEPSGKLVLWLGAEDAADLSRRPSWQWRPAIKIPEASRRVLLIGESLVDS